MSIYYFFYVGIILGISTYIIFVKMWNVIELKWNRFYLFINICELDLEMFFFVWSKVYLIVFYNFKYRSVGGFFEICFIKLLNL